MLRVSVGYYPYLTAWNNFVDTIMWSPDYDDVFNNELAKFNARNIVTTEFIEFNTEEDALAFVLKFG
jgi:hypothetical protein